MRYIKSISVFILCLFSCKAALTQGANTFVNGKIMDSSNKKPIPYADIFFKNSKRGTQSAIDGRFRLNIPKNIDFEDTIVCSSVGYDKREITIRQLTQSPVVMMDEKNITLSDVVIKEYKTADSIMAEVIRRIPENYITDTFTDNLYFRDWRTINDSLYYFSECLMNIYNTGYAPNQSQKRDVWFGHPFCEKDSISNFSICVLDTNLVKRTDYVDDMGFYRFYYYPWLHSTYSNPIPFISEYRFGSPKKKRKKMCFSKFSDENGKCHYKIESLEKEGKFRFIAELVINKVDFAVVEITFKRIHPYEAVKYNSLLSKLIYEKNSSAASPEKCLTLTNHMRYTKIDNKYRLTYVKHNVKTEKITKKELVNSGIADTIITEYTQEFKYAGKTAVVSDGAIKIPLSGTYDNRFYTETPYYPKWKKGIEVPELDSKIRNQLLKKGIAY